MKADLKTIGKRQKSDGIMLNKLKFKPVIMIHP